jgi:hypothetical protein
MRNARANTLIQPSSPALAKKTGGSLALAALLLGGLGIPSPAQTTIDTVAGEQGFTIPVSTSTPIVLMTSPGAMCDLHAEGEDGPEKSLTVYANLDGYLKFVAKATQESDDHRQVLLDCSDATGKVTRYPVSVRVASSPTADMPAPLAKAPTPQGATIRPALTEEEQQTLSNDELASRGYPERPDALASPDRYAFWRKRVSRSFTMLPPHHADSGKSHHVMQAAADSNVWSGYVSTSSPKSYSAVFGTWNVPELVAHYSSSPTYSLFWVGLDGFNLSDLVQAGTQQASIELFGVNYYVYSSWYEILPNEYAQFTELSPNPGDDMSVEVWICCGPGASPNVNGTEGWFTITDWTQNVEAINDQSLGGTVYSGSTVEWIMERPTINNSPTYLADYDYANMIPSADSTSQGWVSWDKLPNLTQLWLYNQDLVGEDNNQLSGAYNHGSADINYVWYNFH